MSDSLTTLEESAEYLIGVALSLGLVLDGTFESIELLDEFIDAYREKRFEGGDADALFGEQRYQTLYAIGAYLGQVIIAESGAARWVLVSDEAGEDDPWGAYLAGTQTDYEAHPFAKVLRRFDGEARHSLETFASAAISLFSGDIGMSREEDARVLV